TRHFASTHLFIPSPRGHRDLHSFPTRRSSDLAVVDDLHEDVARRAGDHQAGALGGADDAATDPQVTTSARTQLAAAVALGVLECVTHDHLPAFPALRTTVSSAYRTPLPL